MKTHLFIILSR